LTTVEGLDSVTDASGYTFTNCAALNSINLPSVLTINAECFRGCSSLKSVYMPNIEFIGDYAFHNTPKLEGEIVLEKLKTLGRNNFKGSLITSLILPSIQGSIGIQCCHNCANLKNILFGSELTSIGGEGFNNLPALESVVLQSTTPPSLGSYVWNGTNNCLFYVPDSSVEAYKTASGWSSYASRIKPISELPTDNPTLYEEIKDYLN
jgi:hypothetical protein